MPTKKEKQPLSVTHPELAKEAFGWDPNAVSHGSNKKMKWKCPNNHIYEAAVCNRTINNSTCPYCARKRVLPGFNDLMTTNPGLGSEAHGWDPTRVMPFSTQNLEWKCSIGHIWSAIVYSRTNGNGCPFCSGARTLSGFNDLATTHPKIASEAFEWDPTTVSAGSGKKLKWQCQVDLTHIYVAPPSERVRGQKCGICAGKKVLIGNNDLATLFPDIASEALGWDPTKFVAFSHSRKPWKCSKNLNHIWNSTIADRSSGYGCPYCAGRKVLVGDNDFATTHPRLASQAIGWDPTLVSFGSHKYVRWQCTEDENHKWMATIKDRASGYGCPSCAKSGFNQIADGYLYFLAHPDRDMYQIGITNYPENRIAQHQKSGWEVIEVRGPMDGHLTQQWETAILRMLKASGADLSNSKIAGKFDGYSEAWSKSTFEIESIKELMRLTEEFESNQL